jgi:hypothetical protein
MQLPFAVCAESGRGWDDHIWAEYDFSCFVRLPENACVQHKANERAQHGRFELRSG